MDWVVQLAVASVPATLGFFGIWATNRTRENTARGPEWKSYADTLVVDIKEQRAIVDKLDQRMSSLEEKLRTMERKYRAAIGYIHELHERLPPSRDSPDPPRVIVDDLK